MLTLAEWKVQQHVYEKHMRVIKIGHSTIQMEIVNVRGSAGKARGAQPSSGRCACRINRHIVYRLAECIGKTHRQTLFEPAMQRDKQALVIRIAAGVLIEDRRKLWVRPEVVCRKPFRD